MSPIISTGRRFFGFYAVHVVLPLVLLAILATSSVHGQARNLVSIRVVDAGLQVVVDTFGVHEFATYCIDGVLDADLQEYGLPPILIFPGFLESRFVEHRSGSSCLELGVNVHIQEPAKLDTFKLWSRPGSGYPLTFTWRAGLAMEGWDTLVIQDTWGGSLYHVDMRTDTVLVVSADTVNTLYIIGKNSLGSPPAGTITVGSPDGGETWEVGTHQNIFWSDTNVIDVKIEYSTDNGSSWATIVSKPSTGSYSWLVPNTPSTQSLVRMKAVEDTSISDASNGVFTISDGTSAPYRRLVPITGRDAGSEMRTDTFGVHDNATYCLDGILDPDLQELEWPPPPSPGIFDFRFVEHRPASSCLAFGLGVHIQEPEKLDTFKLKIQPGAGGYPFTISWRAGLGSEGWEELVIRDVWGGSLYQVDMRTDTSLVVTSDTVNTLYIIGKNSLNSSLPGVVTVKKGWNIISLPLTLSEYRKSILFPDALSPAYLYDGGYVQKDTLSNSVGFWVKFGEEESFPLTGDVRLTDTIDVDSGWNMIGSITDPVAVTAITSIPGGITTSAFYKYDGGYSSTLTIEPGMGYWVKTGQAGKLILSTPGLGSPENRIRILETGEHPPPRR